MHSGTTTIFWKHHQHNTLQVLACVPSISIKRIQATGYSTGIEYYCTSSGSITGCYPTFMTESATGFGTNTGQHWGSHAWSKLKLPTREIAPMRPELDAWIGRFFLVWIYSILRVTNRVLADICSSFRLGFWFKSRPRDNASGVAIGKSMRSIRKLSCRSFCTHWSMERANVMYRSVRLLM